MHKTRKEVYALKSVSNIMVSFDIVLILQRSDIRKELNNEVRVMRTLRHPNIAMLRAVWKDKQN